MEIVVHNRNRSLEAVIIEAKPIHIMIAEVIQYPTKQQRQNIDRIQPAHAIYGVFLPVVISLRQFLQNLAPHQKPTHHKKHHDGRMTKSSHKIKSLPQQSWPESRAVRQEDQAPCMSHDNQECSHPTRQIEKVRLERADA